MLCNKPPTRTGQGMDQLFEKDVAIPYIDPRRRFAAYTCAKSGNTTIRHWFMINAGVYSFWEVLLKMPEPHRRRFLSGMARKRKLAKRVWLRGSRENADLRRFSNMYRATVSLPIQASPEFEDYFKFVVVRNPTSRVVSAYTDKFCGSDRTKPWVQEVVAKAGNADGISFNQFLDFLLASNEEDLNRHWCPQARFFAGVKFDTVIKLEHLSDGMADIESVTGTRGNEAFNEKRQIQSYLTEDFSIRGSVPDMSSGEVALLQETAGGVPSKNSFLTTETREKIKQVYRRDCKQFGYEEDS